MSKQKNKLKPKPKEEKNLPSTGQGIDEKNPKKTEKS